TGRNLVVALRPDLDGDTFVFRASIGAGNARLEAAHQLVLLDHRQPDQYHGAIAEQDSVALVAGSKSPRCRGNEVAALEAGDVDALAQQQRPRRQLTLRGGGCAQGGTQFSHSSQSRLKPLA